MATIQSGSTPDDFVEPEKLNMVKADRRWGERKAPRNRTKGKWKTKGGPKRPGQARKGLGRPGKNNPHIKDD